MKTGKIAMVYAVLAAALYAINVPCSKWLLEHAHFHTHTHVHDGEENVHLHRHQDYGDHSHAHA